MSGTSSDNEWQQVTMNGTMNDKKWQRVMQQVTTSDSSGTMNKNGIVHFKEWTIHVLSMTKTDTILLEGMDRLV